MTVPGGVPNLPAAALTLETLAQKVQDQTAGTIRTLASQRIPAIFDASNGGTILSDLSPFGIITQLWAGFVSAVGNADPADIDGPEDLPGLLLDFIESLPIIGELVGLLEAILGTYDGDDPVLLAVQEIFAPIRKLLQLITGQDVGFPTVEEITVGWTDLATALAGAVSAAGAALAKLVNVNVAGLYDAAAGFNNQATSLLKHLTPTGGNIGQFDASQLQGSLNDAVQIGSTAVSSIFNGTGQFIGVLNSSATGALNSAITYSGTALSTVLTNITASTGALNAAGLSGALNNAVTIGGQAFSTIFNGSGQFIGVLSSSATGALNGAITFGGTTLSTFFTNINSSGNLLASGLTGAINTAATVSGTAIGTLLTNINGSGQFAGSAITGAINTAATVSGQAIGTVQANAQGIINGINNAAAGLLTGGSTAVADAQTNMAAILGGAPANFLGSIGVFGQSATNAAYAAVAAASAAQSAEQARINSAFNAVFNVSPTSSGNTNVTVDFTGVANQTGMSGIMLPGSGSGNGYLGVTSGQAVWQGGTSPGNNSSDFDTEVFPTATTSDYQVITVTLGSLNDSPTQTTSPGILAFIVARSNSARNTCITLWIASNGTNISVSLHYRAGGNDQLFSGGPSALIPTAAVGGTLKWIIGDPSSASPYAMQVLYNGTPIITYTDSSHVSPTPGSGQRYVGLGAWVQSTGPTKTPAAFKTVTYQDNPPPPASYPYSGLPTAGTKGRMYWPNDVGVALRDNGAAWETVWGGNLSAFTTTPTTGWSSVNAGTTTFVADKDAMLLTGPSIASSETLHLWVRTLTPTSNYIAAFYNEIQPMIPSGQLACIVLRDSSSGKLVSMDIGSDTGVNSSGWFLRITKWNTGPAFSAAYATYSGQFLGDIPRWMRWRDDGTTRTAELSWNGVDWLPVFGVGRTDFMTPNQVGVGIFNSNSGRPGLLRMRHFKIN